MPRTTQEVESEIRRRAKPAVVKPPKERTTGKQDFGVKLEDLSVQLTPEEVLSRGHRQAQVVHELAGLELRKKSAMSEFAADKKRLEAELAKLARIVQDGSELRPVQVRTVHDFKAGEQIETRLDTNAVVRRRSLTREERQLEVPGTERQPARTGGEHVTDKKPKDEKDARLTGTTKESEVTGPPKQEPRG
jgi:hypothetical protein